MAVLKSLLIYLKFSAFYLVVNICTCEKFEVNKSNSVFKKASKLFEIDLFAKVANM